jgi:hypothetical protein
MLFILMWQDQKIGLLSGRKPINQDPGSEQPKKRRSVRSYAMYIIWLCTGTDALLLASSSSFFVASSFFVVVIVRCCELM